MPGYGGCVVCVVCMTAASVLGGIRAWAPWPEPACRMALRRASAPARVARGCAFWLTESGSLGPRYPAPGSPDCLRHVPHEAGMNAAHTTWRQLPIGAKAFRVAHGAYSVVGLGSLATVWWSAASRRRNHVFRGAVLFLHAEGGALVSGR